MNLISRLLLPGLLLAGRLCAAPDPWDQLKPGMSREAAMALLGTPLFQTRGHGMETWIYEHGAEVVIHGSVMAWTLPVREPSVITEPLPAPPVPAKKTSKPPVAIVPAPAPSPAPPPHPEK